MLVAVTELGPKATGSTSGMQQTADTSPYYPVWVAAAPAVYDQARHGLLARDIEQLGEAMELLDQFPPAKFDESVDVSVNLGVDAAGHDVLAGRVDRAIGGHGNARKSGQCRENIDQSDRHVDDPTRPEARSRTTTLAW